jgi:hypothetical protein
MSLPRPRFASPPEDYAPFEPVVRCEGQPQEQPGPQAFREFVLREMGGEDWGITRPCEPGDRESKHHEGRAWDWHPDAPADVDEFLGWLLGTDRDGNRHAMARRFGLRTIIWDRRIWTSGTRQWRDYSRPNSNPHIDHVHFGFSHAGADGRTSGYEFPESGGPMLPVILGIGIAAGSTAAALMLARRGAE